MPVISLLFLLYGFYGNLLPPPWRHQGYDMLRLIPHLTITLEGIFGTAVDSRAPRLGGLAIGTTFVDYDKRKLTQWGFAGFAAALTCFALIATPEPAYIVGFMLGFFYFFWP